MEIQVSEVLKAAVTQATALALPNFKDFFTVETDTSEEDIGAVLMQKWQPTTFISKSFSTNNQLPYFQKKKQPTTINACKRN